MYINPAALSKRTPVQFDSFGRPIPGPDTVNMLIGIDGNPVPSPQRLNDAPLILILFGFALLFCIYLYFYISPILKDKSCVAPRSNRPYLLPPGAPEKSHTTQIEPAATNPGTPNREETPADVLEKKKLRNWIQRISHGRFFVMKDNDNGKLKSKMASKEGRLHRYPSNIKASPTQNGVTLPPSAYISPAALRSPFPESQLFISSSPETQIITVPCPPPKDEPRLHTRQRTTSSGSMLTENSGRYPDFRRMSDTQKSQSEPISIGRGIRAPSETVAVDSTPGISGGRIRRITPRVS